MPFDEVTQRSLGLFQGFPAWWKKRNEEGVVDTSHQIKRLSPNQLEFSPVNETTAQTLTKTFDGTAQNPIAQAGSQERVRTGARSQWMRNGIVPFFKGPIASLPQSSQCSSSVSQQRVSMQGQFSEASIGRFHGGPQR